MRRKFNGFQTKWGRAALLCCLVGAFALVNCLYLAKTYLVSFSEADRVFLLGDDLLYHLNRLQSIADGMRGGQFPVRIYPNLLNGYGYASPLFYPDFFLYPFALLVYLGAHTVSVYYLMIFCALFAMGITSYLFARKILPAYAQAVLAACVYLSMQYVVYDVMTRAALGEVLGLVFLPVIALGLYNMVKESFSRPWILLLGVLGVTYSHVISLYMDAWLILGVTLVNGKTLFRDKSWWKKTAILLVLYLLLSAAYFLPFFEMIAFDEYRFSESESSLVSSAKTFPSLFGVWGSIGPIAMLSLLLRLFVRKTEENAARVKLIDKLMLGIAFTLLLTLQIFPWKLFEPLFSYVQMAMRFYAFSCLLYALYLPAILFELCRRPRRSIAVTLALVCAMTVYNLSYLPYSLTGRLDLNYICEGEWLPVKGNDYNRWEGGHPLIENDRGELFLYEREYNTVILSFSAEESEYYRVPLLYYKGYRAILEKEDGTQLSLSLSADETSGMLVETDGEKGKVTIFYEETFLQTFSLILSSASAVLAGAGALALEIKRRRCS